MSESQPYLDEIIAIHNAIATWFSGTGTPAAEALEQLLARFEDDFSMITPNGRWLDGQGLRELFAAAYGRRPGLLIEITEAQAIVLGGDTATLTYLERQSDARSATLRRATVVLRRDGAGTIRWRHLHETWCAQ